MKKLLFTLFLLIGTTFVYGQYYPNIISYSNGGTPVNGIKIKTNVPFLSGYNMPLVKIEGFDYGKRMPLDLSIVWYVYNNKFYVSSSVSSGGGSIPGVWLANENGKVVIFLDEKVNHQKFTVSAYSKGMTGDIAQNFTGWTVVDEALSGVERMKLPYVNNFGGNVGIGTENPQSMLDVRGKIIADEVEVKVNKAPDFVFEPDYNLRSLSEVEAFVKENKHLPEIPSEKQMIENGVNVNDMQMKLLQKIEELTLYVISQEKRLSDQEKRIEVLEQENNELKQTINK